jgi:uncharacterized protein (DUF2252 family)
MSEINRTGTLPHPLGAGGPPLADGPARLRERRRFRPSRAELYARGKSLREKCPRRSHAVWRPPSGREDPLAVLERSDEGRIPELLPIRHGRMLRSPFAFFRGSALNMAADLSATPVSGLRVQACGDCHLLNFGGFATPERRVVFDINDLDETLPAPWEWDAKRLAASFVLACRDDGFGEAAARAAALLCVRSYRQGMIEFGAMPVLDGWHSAIPVDSLSADVEDAEARRRVRKRLDKARRRSAAEREFQELATADGPTPLIRERPPLIYHPRGPGFEGFSENVRKTFARYRESLPEERRVLLDRFAVMDVAVKVVGVGSVGMVCAVVLLMAGEEEPLFLQVKEARPSVLEPYAGKSVYGNHGERVVRGSRLMQSAGDLFLGWTSGELGRHHYVRRLNDMKIKIRVEGFTPGVMLEYAGLCGRCLARAHARSCEPAAIAGYMGKSDVFDEAVADFAVAYADQCERDHEALVRAARSGRLEAFVEPT